MRAEDTYIEVFIGSSLLGGQQFYVILVIFHDFTLRVSGSMVLSTYHLMMRLRRLSSLQKIAKNLPINNFFLEFINTFNGNNVKQIASRYCS